MICPDLSAFGDVHIVNLLNGGHRNAVWLAEDRIGAKYVAKSTRHTETALEWLEPLYCAAQLAGFQVPLPRRTSAGCLSSNGITLEPFLRGRNPSPDEVATLGPQLREFHRNAVGIGQRPGVSSELRLGSMVLFAPTDVDSMPAQLREQCCAAMSAIHTLPVQAIHGDLQPTNILIGTDGAALIDWDEARVDYQFLDELCWRAPTDTERSAHLAIEIANGWLAEPDYARRLAALL